MPIFDIEYTDTFAGESNYCWVKRASVSMPCLTQYGYTGSTDGSYTKANATFERELMKKAKAKMGLTGVRGRKVSYGDMIEFRPYGLATVMFINYRDPQ